MRQIKRDWIDFPGDYDVKFKIRPFSVLHFTVPPSGKDNFEKVKYDVFNTCLIDWQGLKDEDGKDMLCTEENRDTVAKEWKDILDFVFEYAANLANIEKDVTEEEIKN